MDPSRQPLPSAQEPQAKPASNDTPFASTLDYHAATLTSAEATERPKVDIAGYEILAVLGRGGMGVVYKARQVRLNRLVALKMVLRGVHAGAEERQRLHTEAEAIARLQHPNIVQIFEIGVVDSCPFLALEFVGGGTLAQRLNGTPWPNAPSARLVETLARAIHYAHEQGIVHRDLKPTNVLLAVSDQPSAVSQNTAAGPELTALKISDFGLARLLEGGAGLTQSGAFMGTPSYAAPEQAAGDTRSSGPAADIYALGAILYELLTGRPPFRAASVLETLDQLRHQEPVPPRMLNPAINRDVETIRLKCLRKSPRERYASAAELADDLRRFSAGEPIRARPAGIVELFVKWVKRRPALAASMLFAALAVTALVVLGVGSSFYSRLHGLNARLETTNAELSAAKKLAEREGDKARELEAKAIGDRYVSDVQLASRAWQEGHMTRMALLLERQKPEFTKGQDLRGFEWHYLYPLLHTESHRLQGGELGILTVAFAPGSAIAAAGSRAGDIKLWDTDSGREFLFFPKQAGSVGSVAFTPDASMLATAIYGSGVLFWNLLAPLQRPPGMRDGKLHKEEFLLETEYDMVNAIAFNRDGSRIAAVSYQDYKQGAVQVWDVETRREVFHRPLTNYPHCLAFHPDGRHLAVGVTKLIQIWDTRGAEKTARTIPAHNDIALLSALAYSPDGKYLASAALNKKERAIKVWNAASGELVRQLEGHSKSIVGLAFNADGKWLASASYDTTARIWELDSGQSVRVLKGHTNNVYAVAFHANGKQLASASDDQTVRIWKIARKQDVLELTGAHFGHHIWSLHFSPEGSLVAGIANGGVATFSPQTDALLKGVRLPSLGKTLVSRNGKHALTLQDGRAKFWDVGQAKEMFSVAAGNGEIKCAAFDAAGKRLALGRSLRSQEDEAPEGVVELWDISTGTKGKQLRCSYKDVTSVAFSPDGALLAIGGENSEQKVRIDLHSLTLWDLAAGSAAFRSALLHSDVISAIAFSPDGTKVAWVSADGNVRMLDRVSSNERLIGGHVSGVHSVAFSPDGKRLATGSDGDVRLWDVATGQETLTLQGHVGEIYALAFSADGQMLASGGWDTTVRVWQALRR